MKENTKVTIVKDFESFQEARRFMHEIGRNSKVRDMRLVPSDNYHYNLYVTMLVG